MAEDLFTRITNLEKDLGPQQQKVADYFLSHGQELAFKTTSEISLEIGVSEPTIIRFVRRLGYKGYVDFRDEVQVRFMEKFGPSEKFHKVSGLNKDINEIFNEIEKLEIRNLRETLNGIDIHMIRKVIRAIIGARTKYVIGLRTSSGSAFVLGRILSHLLPNVSTILDGDIRMYEDLRAIGKQDVLISVSFPRYLKNTVEALQFAKRRNATTIAITDSRLSPTAQIAEYVIVAPSNSRTFANSYTACSFVINLLTAGIVKLHQDKKMEAVLEEWENSLGPLNYFLTE